MPAEFGSGPAGPPGDPGPTGPQGADGTELIVGHGAPVGTDFEPGDTYIDENTGDLYRFV